MSSKKIKHKEGIKELNKKLKEAFSGIQDDVKSGKFCPIRSLRGLIHCSFDEHQTFLNVSALKEGQLTPAVYFRLDALTEPTIRLILEELQFFKDQILDAETAKTLMEVNASKEKGTTTIEEDNGSNTASLY